MSLRGIVIRRVLARYTAAFLMVAAAASVRAAVLGDLGQRLPHLTFYPAVIIAALYGGVGPGLFAMILSALIAALWMEPVGHPFASHSVEDWQTMSLYLLTATMIIGVCEAMRRAEERAIRADSTAEGQRALRNSEEKFRLLVEHAPAAIAMLDREIRYVAVSRRWISDFKLEGREFLGRSFYEVQPDLPPRWKEIHGRVLAGAVEQSDADSFQRADGQIDWLHWEARPWRDARGEIGGIIVFSELITHRKQMEQSLIDAKVGAESAKGDAERANRAKDHFLAILSHELRTPLTPVLTTAQMMEQDESLPASVRDSAEIIRRNVELEARLIDDLLDLTRISRGKLELQLRNIEVHKKIRHIIQICDSDLRSKQLRLDVRLDAPAHNVFADAARLQQVFWNLLKNAVKFTPAGGEISIVSRNVDPKRLQIQVNDTGIGIDLDVLPKIFDAFEQGSVETTRLFGGLGLGLSISKSLMEMHGGTLTATSAGRGCGASFTAEFPLAASLADDTGKGIRPPVGLTDAERAALMGHRILLVEDHADSAKAMSRFLKSLGYQVQFTNSVASALQAATAEKFDLLISDIGLPDGSGLDLMQQLRLKGPLTGIAISGFGMEEDVTRSREAGFAEHLTKPIDTQRLEEVIRRALETAESSKSRPTFAEAANPA